MKRPTSHPAFYWLKIMVFTSVIGTLLGRMCVTLLRISGYQGDNIYQIGVDVSAAYIVLMVILAARAWRNVKESTESVTFDDRDEFVANLVPQVMRYGFKPTLQEQKILVFKAGSVAALLYDMLTVELSDGKAEITGPKAVVKRLAKPVDSKIANRIEI